MNESLVYPIPVENVGLGDQDVMLAEPFSAKSQRVERIELENLKASLKEERTSEIKGLLVQSQKELLSKENPKEHIQQQTLNLRVLESLPPNRPGSIPPKITERTRTAMVLLRNEKFHHPVKDFRE